MLCESRSSLLGASGVGKHSLVSQFCSAYYSIRACQSIESHKAPIGSDIKVIYLLDKDFYEYLKLKVSHKDHKSYSSHIRGLKFSKLRMPSPFWLTTDFRFSWLETSAADKEYIRLRARGYLSLRCATRPHSGLA